MASLIAAQSDRWPTQGSENVIWGLIRIVIAQQVSTHRAWQIVEQLTSIYPEITKDPGNCRLDVNVLRQFGIPEKRANCCITISQASEKIKMLVDRGASWEEALLGIKGIGPWTLAVFRIMVLREPDVLPLGDIGLERAIRNFYGEQLDVEELAEKWRPFRSVACWYLWRTLGNRQLG